MAECLPADRSPDTLFPLASIHPTLIFHPLSTSLSHSPLLATPFPLNLRGQEGLTLSSFLTLYSPLGDRSHTQGFKQHPHANDCQDSSPDLCYPNPHIKLLIYSSQRHIKLDISKSHLMMIPQKQMRYSLSQSSCTSQKQP